MLDRNTLAQIGEIVRAMNNRRNWTWTSNNTSSVDPFSWYPDGTGTGPWVPPNPPEQPSSPASHLVQCPQCGMYFQTSSYGVTLLCPSCAMAQLLQGQRPQGTLGIEELEMLAELMQKGYELDSLESFVRLLSNGTLVERLQLYKRAWEVLKARIPELVPARALDLPQPDSTSSAQEE